MTGVGLRCRGERGTGVVEAAVVFPLLMLLFLGMVDVGLWVFETTQAASGARDGARRGLLVYRQADVPTSADAATVRAAAVRHIGSEPFGAAVTVEVRCVGPSGSTPLVGGCAAANVLNRDRIQVTVTWQRRALSAVSLGFGPTQRVTGRAAMAIRDRPPGAEA